MNRVKRETYEKETEKRLEGMYGRVDQVQDYVNEHGSHEAEPELKQHLEALKKQRIHARTKWDALKATPEDNWDRARVELDEAVDDLHRTLIICREYIEKNHDHSLGWTEGYTEKKEHDSAGWPEGAGEIKNGSEGWPEGSGEIDENSEGWEEGYDQTKKTTS